MTLISDPLTLTLIKKHLSVEFSDDDELIQSYSTFSLDYVQNHAGYTFADYEGSQLYNEWIEPMVIDYPYQGIRQCSINYPTLTGSEDLISLVIDNIILATAPDDLVDGIITVTYSTVANATYVNIANQARLLLIGSAYMQRENDVVGTSATEIPQGVERVLSTIWEGRAR